MKTNSEGTINGENQKIRIYFLDKIWAYYLDLKRGKEHPKEVEWKYFNGVCNALGVGIEPLIKYLMATVGTFEDFERWLHLNGNISNVMIDQFNELIDQEKEEISVEKIFTQTELEHWENEGYVILRNAISKEDCAHTVDYILDQIEANRDDPTSWYSSHALKQGIMLQLFSSPTLDKNRLSEKIKLAYQQLWNRNDIMVSMDRVSFNPPETESYHFPGPNLHWDVSLKRPIPFGLQGLLYLVDTDENQGAFTLIPGFHKKMDDWLNQFNEGEKPRDKNLLDEFNPKPIGAKAGDFIIWNHCLPHGSSPNTSNKPRIVQYINYQPLNMEYQEEWI